jgi:hypothetical protein
LLYDVKAGVTQPNTTLKMGFIEKAWMDISAGKVIRSYGRIDHHPRNEKRYRLEVFLFWDNEHYWMVLNDANDWSKWPIGVAEALNHLFPRIHELMSTLK